MASTPRFEGPDGTLREHYIFTTTISGRFFVGEMDPATVDMQVSIRGGGFSSDPDYIIFEGSRFIVPNPSVFPDGLQLLAGANDIGVKSILTNGEVSSTGTVRAILSTDKDIRGIAFPPSGIFIERFDGTVAVTVEGIDSPLVRGYHFYASTSPGGGTIGYSRINPVLVVSGDTIEDRISLASLQVDASISTGSDGVGASSPVFYVVQGIQQDQQEELLQTDYHESLEIPTNVNQVRVSTLVESVRTVQRYSFTHDRTATFDSSTNPAIPNADFNTILRSDPLYYVVTAVWVIDGKEFESDFSPEVAGSPLVLTPSVGSFPTVTRQQIIRDTTLSIFRSQPEVDVKPGSTTRDIFIDPFSTEAERVRFLTDFVHNAQSFSTLLLIDDPGNTGVSIDVNQSAYKQALRAAFFLDSNDSVQALIDNAFDKIASNYGETRLGGRRSRGEVTVSISGQPAQTLNFPIGQQCSGGGFPFRFTSSTQITPSGSGAFFNPVTGRFSARAFIQAETPGVGGNLAPGQINVILDPPAGAKVTITNQGRTFGGQDEESNRDLAVRVQRKLASLDTGRFQGYVNTASRVPGVLQANVVDAGHSLMMRDINESGHHIGGKVDVWVRGESLATVTDRFAFSFRIKKDVPFEIVGDPKDLIFRAVDPDLSGDNPIIEMMDFPSAGFVFRNSNTSHVYDLTGVTILRPNGIQLDGNLNSPDGSLSDVFFGSYRYRSSNRHVFSRQPVRSIVTFQGAPDRSGVISPVFYGLFHQSDPLELGRSSEAGDYVQIIEPLDVEPLDVPSSDPVIVADEQHVVLDGIEYLDNFGVNPATIQVWNDEKTIEYASPFVSATPDYTVIDEDPPSPLGIKLTSASSIKDGQTVLVDYQHDENFTVEFTTNSLVSIVQEEIATARHLTADALSKEAVDVPVDLSGTVVLRNGEDASLADSSIRTVLSRLFGALSLGEPLRQSDVLNVLDTVDEVSYVVTPLAKMVKADGATVVREPLFTDRDSDWNRLDAWSTPTVYVYLLNNPLGSSTSDGGGSSYDFRGVFASEAGLVLFDDPPNNNGTPLKNQVGAAFIVGNGGINIPGFSDDVTLALQYPLASLAELEDKRVSLTANRVLVTLTPDQTPSDFEYTVTYLVSEDSGVKNIEPGPIEYLVIGDINFAFDEDFNFSDRITGRSR